MNFVNFLLWWEIVSFVVYIKIFCVGAGIFFLMPSSDELGPYIFRQKMEKTRSVNWELNGKVFISRQSWWFFLSSHIIRTIFPMCTLTWRINNYFSLQGNVLTRETEVIFLFFLIISTEKKGSHCDYQLVVQIVTIQLVKITFSHYSPELFSKIQVVQSSQLLNIFFSENGHIEKQAKVGLAVVSRKTQEEHSRTASHETYPLLEISTEDMTKKLWADWRQDH